MKKAGKNPQSAKALKAVKPKGFCRRAFKVCGPQKGQVIIEYILLIVVSTVMALALINFISVESSDSNIFLNYWQNLLTQIGEDIST